MQPLSVNIWKANAIRKGVYSKLDDLVLRQKSDDKGLKKAKMIEAALAWFQGKLAAKARSKEVCYFEQALTRLPLAKSGQEVL